MPGPGAKGKTSKTKKKGSKLPGAASSTSTPAQCQTLEEDEMTRCDQPVTADGRCKVHAEQYRTMYRKYKAASKTVDEIKQNKNIPTKEQTERLTKDRVSQTIRWLHQYLEAIRIERTGRDIHMKRFFIKSDDGHKIRLKLLAKEMTKAAEALDHLYTRAVELDLKGSGIDVPEWVDLDELGFPKKEDANPFGTPSLPLTLPGSRASPFAELPSPNRSTASPRTLLGSRTSPFAELPSTGESISSPSAEEDADLIEDEIIAEKAKMLRVIQFVWDLDMQKSYMFKEFVASNKAQGVTVTEVESVAHGIFEIYHEIYHLMNMQFARRIVFHDPVLHYKSLGKVSFQDLVLSKDFGTEDLAKFAALFFGDRLGFSLAWLKDALVEALVMSRPGSGSANVGNIENRISILGGWIFNNAHTRKMSNEAWWYLLKFNDFPPSVENRLVRLCHSFDDIIGFLSFAAFDLLPPPSFVRRTDPSQDAACRSARKNLSLSGVIVSDMINGSSLFLDTPGPFPNVHMKARKRGCIVWIEFEGRSHIFGALRNEPDAFTEAFLQELRSRPDLFQVITRSETDPPLKVDLFGDGPNAALPQRRMRTFEAPANNPGLATERGPWEVEISAVDRLYGTGELPGLLTELNRRTWKPLQTSFFRFLSFPVKYFVILDTFPNRAVSFVAQNVAWAALRAGGYAKGEFEAQKYHRASEALFEKSAQERLWSWMSKIQI